MKTRRSATVVLVLALAAASSRAAHAQNATTPDSASRTPAVRTLGRASWLSDRAPLRVGDLVTVMVDEQTTAREQVSQVAQGQRSQKATMSADINGSQAVKPSAVGLGLDGQSRDVGEARRLGDLSGVLTTRVVAITPDGLLSIEGDKKVTVDGRPQSVTLKGLVRPQDVGPGNRVQSNRIANADIQYNGKKMTPRTGFIGKFLGMLWP